MWDELKRLGGALFFVGCIITWISFLAPHINPTWISDPYQLWQIGVLILGIGIGIFVLAWIFYTAGRIRLRRRGIYFADKRMGRTTKLIVGGLILTIVAWGLVTYGPRLVELIGGGGALSPAEVKQHPEKYLGKTVTVEGWYYPALGIAPMNMSEVDTPKEAIQFYQDSLDVNLPKNTQVFQGAKYRFTGTVIKQGQTVKLDVSSIEPV